MDNINNIARPRINYQRYKKYLEAINKNKCIDDNMLPKQLEIELTLKCNLKCLMCKKWKQGQKEKDGISTDKIKDIIHEAESIGIESIIISGGEPLIRSDIEQIIKLIGNSNISGSIITNGTLLNDKISKLLLNNNFEVNISIDGSNKKIHDSIRNNEGTFDLVMKNLKDHIKNMNTIGKGRTHLLFVIQKENVQDIIPFSNMVEELGITCSFEIVGAEDNERFPQDKIEELIKYLKNEKSGNSPKHEFSPTHNNKEMMEAILDKSISKESIEKGEYTIDLFKKNPVPCFKGADSMFIDAKGNTFPCCFGYDEEMKPLGNVNSSSLKTIWFSNEFNQFRCKTNPIDIGNNEFKRVCDTCELYFDFKKINDEIKTEKSLDYIENNSKTISNLNKRNISDTFILYVDRDCNDNEEEDVVCNFRCIHCYSRFSKRKMKTAQEMILEINEAKRRGAKHVQITGGEPTVSCDLFEIMKHIKNNDMICSVITNGFKLDSEEYVSSLAKNVDYILLSIHGGNEKTWQHISGIKNSWNHTIKALELLNKFCIEVHVEHTIMKTNNGQLPSVIEMISKYNNVKRINIMPFNPWWKYDPNDARINKIKDILVSYDEMMPHIIRATNICVDERIDFAIRYFPFCKVPEKLRKFCFNHITSIMDENEWNREMWLNPDYDIQKLYTLSKELNLIGPIQQRLEHAFGRSYKYFRILFTETKSCKECSHYLICDQPHNEQIKLFPDMEYPKITGKRIRDAAYYFRK